LSNHSPEPLARLSSGDDVAIQRGRSLLFFVDVPLLSAFLRKFYRQGALMGAALDPP
jgi:hypothetical protein